MSSATVSPKPRSFSCLGQGCHCTEDLPNSPGKASDEWLRDAASRRGLFMARASVNFFAVSQLESTGSIMTLRGNCQRTEGIYWFTDNDMFQCVRRGDDREASRQRVVRQVPPNSRMSERFESLRGASTRSSWRGWHLVLHSLVHLVRSVCIAQKVSLHSRTSGNFERGASTRSGCSGWHVVLLPAFIQVPLPVFFIARKPG